MADYQSRFGVGKIALVADRGLISEKNLQDVAAAGFDDVLATRLHHDGDVAAVLERAAAAGDDAWRAVPGFPGTKAFEVNLGGRRFVVASVVRADPGRFCSSPVSARCASMRVKQMLPPLVSTFPSGQQQKLRGFRRRRSGHEAKAMPLHQNQSGRHRF